MLILASQGSEIGKDALDHLRSCSDCRAEVSEVARIDSLLAGTFQSLRSGIPGPSSEEIGRILTAVRPEPPLAQLYRRIHRSVKRMLLLTLLVLSFLLIAGIAWAIVLWWKSVQGG